MREHMGLYRGKRIDNGEWVEGYYVRLFDGKGNVSHRIYNGYAETDCGEFYPDWFEVDPDTVGECAMMTDKNDDLIFEGDICDHHVQGNILINRGVVNWDAKHSRWAFQLNTMNPDFYMHNPAAWEIIGNIHDNPELLKSEG